MGWFESKDERQPPPRSAGVPMGPSLMPPSSPNREGGSSPVKTFRAPGASPITIGEQKASKPADNKEIKAASPGKPGGSKVALIVAGVVALAAVSVVAGWLLTN